MTKPKVADNKPLMMEMQPGTYYWCACGQSSNQPFCDGSHKGSGFTPKPVEIKEVRTVFWCMCKQSGNAPFCDGTHKKL
ncbi:MAG: CDGSH iron-sulfur domain-containing protein [Prolixibacteraceae bacterium]|jgi:CDGSH-type Zn-finger protein|nr:CDGSH iron-sulfur domain-containing protein [Prolixibacteraceae bacterium]